MKDEDLRCKSTNEEVARLVEFVGYGKEIFIDDVFNRMGLADSTKQ